MNIRYPEDGYNCKEKQIMPYMKIKKLMDHENHPLMVANGLFGLWINSYEYHANMERDTMLVKL